MSTAVAKNNGNKRVNLETIDTLTAHTADSDSVKSLPAGTLITGWRIVRQPDGSDEPYKRLAGWKRIELAPHESRAVTIAIDSRVLQTFDETSSHWKCAPGDYKVSVGGSSDRISLSGNLRVQ